MASADGWFYMFDVNTQEGGVCKLLTQASIYTSNPNNQLFTSPLGNNNNIVANNAVNNIPSQNFNQNQADEGSHQHQQQMYENNQAMES